MPWLVVCVAVAGCDSLRWGSCPEKERLLFRKVLPGSVSGLSLLSEELKLMPSNQSGARSASSTLETWVTPRGDPCIVMGGFCRSTSAQFERHLILNSDGACHLVFPRTPRLPILSEDFCILIFPLVAQRSKELLAPCSTSVPVSALRMHVALARHRSTLSNWTPMSDARRHSRHFRR